MTIATDSYRYILEFKFDRSAQEALQQIDSTDYPLPFAADHDRKTFKIGVNISSERRNIKQYIVQEQ
ncbi:MAG: PD-(D/E)XK nuclease domain-containing protein [Bacteroidales bacterium]|nr:PD-(D/E)XK nuclease domain-containing protein [Bacteroidales bacterium]